MKILHLTSIFAFGIFVLGSSARAESFKIRWLLAHDPVKAFDNAAKKFKETVEKNTNGDVVVETLTVKQFTGGKQISQSEAFDKLRAGEYEMCQTFGTFLGSKEPQFWVFDLPYLFRSYQHAEHVIEGPIGREILATLDKDDLKGMAITYSGGFRVVPAGSRKLAKIEDFKGMHVRVPQYGSVTSAFFEKLGADPVGMSPEVADKVLSQNDLDGVETTLPRFWELENRNSSHVVNDTGHSLYVTALVLNKKFFEKLPEKYRKVVLDAAHEAAAMERADAIQLGEDLKKEIRKNGMQLVSLSEKEKSRLRKASAGVVQEFEPIVGRDLIQRVRDTK